MTEREGFTVYDQKSLLAEIGALKARVSELSDDRQKVTEKCQQLEKERDAAYKASLTGEVPEEFKNSPTVTLVGALFRRADGAEKERDQWAESARAEATAGDEARSDRAQMMKERDAAVKNLRKYGVHKSTLCLDVEGACGCGLEKALGK